MRQTFVGKNQVKYLAAHLSLLVGWSLQRLRSAFDGRDSDTNQDARRRLRKISSL